jgi:hypothetical protein
MDYPVYLCADSFPTGTFRLSSPDLVIFSLFYEPVGYGLPVIDLLLLLFLLTSFRSVDSVKAAVKAVSISRIIDSRIFFALIYLLLSHVLSIGPAPSSLSRCHLSPEVADGMEDELRTLLSFSGHMLARWRTGYKWRAHMRGHRRRAVAVSRRRGSRLLRVQRASVSSIRSWSLFGVLCAAPPTRFHSWTVPSMSL